MWFTFKRSFEQEIKKRGGKKINAGYNSFMEAVKANGTGVAIRFNSKKVTASYKFSDNKFISAAPIDDERRISYPDHKGGIIVFSTDVNAVKMSENAIANWIKQKLTTLKQRLMHKKIMTDTIKKYDEVYGFTIGNFMSGRYKSNNGKIFDEHSMSVEIIGITRETLFEIADELMRAFNQESVLVRDYESGNIAFINNSVPTEIQERDDKAMQQIEENDTLYGSKK